MHALKKLNSIFFCSQHIAEGFIPVKDHGIISITCPGEIAKLKWENILRLQFHDISKQFDGEKASNFYDPNSPILLKAFDENQANQIIDFIESLPDNVVGVVVHCSAGISRSAAVAEFLRVNYSDMERLNKSVSNMNAHVYSTLIEAFHKKYTM